MQRCIALVIPRVYLRPLDQQRQRDVVVPVTARQMQGRVLDASLRVEIRPLVDELSHIIIHHHDITSDAHGSGCRRDRKKRNGAAGERGWIGVPVPVR